ncbi:hypothetical protein, partial [Candidatus Pelagibacter communis]|uniref:hypothetical protein n=2 Tax=Pelagibacter ubique TaxID=198252 RepID=UPI000AB1B3EA
MNKNIFLSLIVIFIFYACEKEPIVEPETSTEIVLGASGDPAEYFYDFYSNSDISSKYLFYSTSTQINAPSTLDPTKDTLNLRSFSQHLLTVSSDEYSGYTTKEPFSEIEQGIDINNDGVYHGSVIDKLTFTAEAPWYQPYTLIEKITWDDENNRYSPGYGSSDRVYDTLYYTQPTEFDSLIFKSVIDSDSITSTSEFAFIDQNEYNSTVQKVTTGEDTTIIDTLYFKKRFVEDFSYARLKNMDCNEDGRKTDAETRTQVPSECPEGTIFLEDATGGFCDITNEKFNDAEVYLDLPSGVDLIHNFNEPFQDRNCNDVADSSEERVDSNCSFFCSHSSYLDEDDCLENGSVWVQGIFRT